MASFLNAGVFALATSTTKPSATLSSISVGDLILVNMGTGNVATDHVSSLALSTGTATWTKVTGASIAYTGSGDSNYSSVWMGVVTSAGTTPTLQVTKTAACQMAGVFIQFTHIAGTITLDKAVAAQTLASTSVSSGSSGTLNQALEIAIGTGTDNYGTGQTYTVGGSWLSSTSEINADISLNVAYQIVNSTTALTYTATLAHATDNTGAIVTFKIPLTTTTATWAGNGSFSAVGVKAIQGVATWAPQSALSFVSPSGGNTATFTGHSVFSATGNALKNGTVAWTSHSAFTAIGAAITKGVAIWSPNSSFSATGHNNTASIATWSSHASLSLTGSTIKKSIANWNPSASLSMHAGGNKAIWTGHASLSMVGKTSKFSAATWTSHSTLSATGRAIIPRTINFNSNASLSIYGKSSSQSSSVISSQAALSFSGASIAQRAININSQTVLNFVDFASRVGTALWNANANFECIEYPINVKGRTLRAHQKNREFVSYRF